MSKKYKELDESLDSTGMVALSLGVSGAICVLLGVLFGMWIA